jgi:histidinol-phosphate aminotransferase
MLADHLSIDEDWVLVGTGSGEILKLAPLVCVRNGGNVVSTLESYRSTPDFATALGADIKWVRLHEDGSYDVEGLLNAVDSNTKLFYLVQPNNPTGTLLDYSGLVRIADALPRDVLFLIDEAYIHFCPEGRTGLDLLKAGYENVLVTRTFSKAYALAGLRCGYGMGHPNIMRKLAAFGCGPTSTNMAGYGAAAASLQDDTHVLRSREYVQRSRAYFEDQFRQMGLNYLSGPPTFILVEVGERAGAIRQALLDRKIYVRSGDEWELPRHLRISYGLEEEHQAFFAALKDLLD